MDKTKLDELEERILALELNVAIFKSTMERMHKYMNGEVKEIANRLEQIKDLFQEMRGGGNPAPKISQNASPDVV